MPYVIQSVNRLPGYKNLVFTRDEIERLRGDGNEYVVVNTTTRHSFVINPHPARKKFGARYLGRDVYQGEVGEQLLRLGFSPKDAEEAMTDIGVFKYYGLGYTPREAAERIYDIHKRGY